MNRTYKLIKKTFLILLIAVTLFSVSFSRKNQEVIANGETEYLKKGNGQYLTYRNSSEKVLALKEYDNPIQEFRACWVSHFAGDLHQYVDEASYKKEIDEMLDNMEAWGMNAVMFHIRTHNNAFYQSELNPVARWYVNVNFDEFDPLTYIIEECHKRGIEFHAWMNPYRVDDNNIVGEYPAVNPVNDSNNLLTNGSGTILNPGLQVVRDFIVDTCMEVIEKYDVDAIHFDDYFYISGVETSKSADWKRQQVDLFIEQLHDEMTAFNEENGRNVQLGISPSGIYRNGSYASTPTYDSNGNLSSPLGSNTSGFAHYGDYLYSDTLHWINEGWIDYITPQTYWGLEMNVASYASLTRWWSWALEYKDVNLYMGMGIYMAIEGSGAWTSDANEVDKQLRNAAMYDEIDGICVYKYSSLLSSNTTVQNGVKTFEKYWANKKLPSAVQRSYANKVPSYPVTNLCEINGRLIWDEVENVRGYMVYKVPVGTVLDKNNLDHLLEYTQDTSIFANDTVVYDYYVATVNRANVIGEPIKLETNSNLAPSDIVINRISSLPTNITLDNEVEVNSVLYLYNNLSAEEKAKVINYNILEQAVKTIQNIKSLEKSMNDYLDSLDKNLKNGEVLVAPENMKWGYKTASDSVAYNLATGEILGQYLNRVVTLTLTGSVPNSTVTKVIDVEFNASIIPHTYTALIYRNDASCMTPNDTGEYSPTDSKYIGWSNVILYVGDYALPIAVNSYIEASSTNELKQVYWTSCGALVHNTSSGKLSFSLLNTIFESATANYGHFIIGANGKIKSVSDTTDYTTTITLEAGESIFVSRYLERTINNTPFTSLSTSFDTNTLTSIVKYEKDDTGTDTSIVANVISAINLLPSTITLADEEFVNSALELYNALTDAQKAEVTNYSILESAVNKIKTLKEEKAKLEAAKLQANSAISNYVKLSNYSASNQATIKGYMNVYLDKVASAQTVEQVNTHVSEYKARVDNIKPLVEELKQAKANAKIELNNYLDLTNYTENGAKEIEQILKDCESRVDSATDFDKLNDVVKAIKAELDEVLTIQEELQELKAKYRNEIYTYYNESDYSINVADEIANKANSIVLELSRVETIEALEALIQDFVKEISDYIKISESEQLVFEKTNEMKEMVSEEYASEMRVTRLLESYERKLAKATLKSELDEIVDEFELEYAELREAIDQENKNNNQGSCTTASTMLTSLLGAISLIILVLRKKR